MIDKIRNTLFIFLYIFGAFSLIDYLGLFMFMGKNKATNEFQLELIIISLSISVLLVLINGITIDVKLTKSLFKKGKMNIKS